MLPGEVAVAASPDMFCPPATLRLMSSQHPSREPGLTPGAHPERRHPDDGHGGHDSSHDEMGMGMRGVTRPMAEREIRQSHESGGGEHEGGGDGGGGMQHGEPYSDGRYKMLRMHHKQTLWVYWMLIMLGVWTLLAPFTLGYLNEALWVDPSGGRGVWFGEETHTALRAWLMTWSDVISGFLLVVFGWRMLTPNRPISGWICCFVGIWMTFAPVMFWAPTAAAYLNGTLVGMLVIALTILIPGMPNMIVYMKMGPPTPPGWSYNPSSWPQRWIMIVLGFAGLLASRYLAAFQLGYIDTIWEPFFGDGTRQVLNSSMSHSFPVSDAGLGALAFTIELLMSFMGSPKRWRTMPWMVTIFGIVVIPLGLVHVFLVASQPVVVGEWCTFCLLAAAIMLPMIPLEVDEVIAMGQHMVQSKRRGDSLWTVFWKGGSSEGSQPDERSPELVMLPRQPGKVYQASIWGMSFPWTLTLATALGVWLLIAPGALGIEKPAANVSYIGGSLVIMTAVIAMAEPVRALRYLIVPMGLAVAVVPWLWDGSTTTGHISSLLAGLVVAALALPRGPIREHFGSWDRLVR